LEYLKIGKEFFLIGFKDVNIEKIEKYEKTLSSKAKNFVSVKDAIFDLSKYNGLYSHEVDTHKLNLEYDNPYLKNINFQDKDISIIKSLDSKKEKGVISGLMVTKHSEKVIERFSSTVSGTREPISRYYKLDWLGISPTLRAGTTRARGQFMAPRPIHPKYPRCITVREAARLHSYPDYFEFYPTKWYGQMQIGNSVPPLLASKVANFVCKVLN
jgi:DNA (cytosine-5)-methyltransferase 1